jgi:hypothetical protein
MSWALAWRGLAMNQAGRPVASARSPMNSAPNSPASSASLRFTSMVLFLS